MDRTFVSETRVDWTGEDQGDLSVYEERGVRHLCIAGGKDNLFKSVGIEVWGVQ